MAQRLQGKVALVSGGARGMGAAEARLFVSEGAQVVIGDVLVDEGKALADELGDAVRFVELDVTDEASWQAAVSAATTEFGRLDVLVNNAGIWKIMPIAMMSTEDYMEVVKVNQLGVFLGMKSAVLPMSNGGGSIVNISSVAGLTGAIGQVAYGATKWAVRGMTKTAAIELAGLGIRVNSIHPGLIDTQMLQTVRDWGVEAETLLTTVPQGRFGSADEVAKVALFLASDDSSHCTGGEFTVDGGMTAGFAPRDDVRFGLSLGLVHPGVWRDLTIEGERLGFESVWLPEHLVLPVAMEGSPYGEDEHPPVPPKTKIYDAPSYLSFLAGLTSTIRLGTWVYLLNIRHPFTGARGFATVDVVSDGRAEVGVGAGWLRAEWDAVGLDPRTRGRRLDEAIDVCRRLWSEDVIEHHGEFFDFGPVMFEPKPVQQPMPVLVGGESEPALRRAIARGDGWIGMGHTPESVAPIAKRLRAERGDTFTITIGGTVSSADDIERYTEAGVDRVIVSPWSRTSEALDGIKRFADTLF